MFQGAGWLREKMGGMVNKVIVVRKVQDGRLRFVRQLYVGDGDSEVKISRNRKLVVRPSLWCYERKNVRVQYRDVDSGDAVRFDGLTKQILSPEELDAVTTAGGVKKILLGGGLDANQVMWLVAGLGVGLFVGYILAGYLH